MNICQNCKHWTRDEKSRFRDGRFGICNCPKFRENPDGESCERDTLCYYDHEGYSASFKTGENFGCIHFSEATDGYCPKCGQYSFAHNDDGSCVVDSEEKP